ncbi:tRNA synthetase class I (I, L, M and V) family protein [Artemisia annua]|uniref:tRNA synthetase class I (I, L, M and V) family protein n=1 Tax=Artemisia annua TaxID=35608 RepID=A0A2U1N0I1_ARTAN|nr:tRNA synthetase class I (I, L, M and V) family protein [Artemisia annua]
MKSSYVNLICYWLTFTSIEPTSASDAGRILLRGRPLNSVSSCFSPAINMIGNIFITSSSHRIYMILLGFQSKGKMDGWRFKCGSLTQLKDDSLSMNMKFTSHEGTMSGLVVVEWMLTRLSLKVFIGSDQEDVNEFVPESYCDKASDFVTGTDTMDVGSISGQVSSVDYTADVLIGSQVLRQILDIYRKQGALRFFMIEKWLAFHEEDTDFGGKILEVNKALETAYFSKLIGSSLKVKVYLHSFYDNLVTRIRNMCEAKVDAA